MSRIRLNVGLGVSVLSRGTTTFEFIVILEIQLHEKNKTLKNCRGTVMLRWLHTQSRTAVTLLKLELVTKATSSIFVCLNQFP